MRIAHDLLALAILVPENLVRAGAGSGHRTAQLPGPRRCEWSPPATDARDANSRSLRLVPNDGLGLRRGRGTRRRADIGPPAAITRPRPRPRRRPARAKPTPRRRARRRAHPVPPPCATQARAPNRRTSASRTDGKPMPCARDFRGRHASDVSASSRDAHAHADDRGRRDDQHRPDHCEADGDRGRPSPPSPKNKREPRSSREREVQRQREHGKRSAPPRRRVLARLACATSPTASSMPIAAASPKASQYPIGSASRCALNASSRVPNRSGNTASPARRPRRRSCRPRSARDRRPITSPEHERDSQRRPQRKRAAAHLAGRRRHADRPDASTARPHAESASSDANAMRSRPGAETRSRIRSTVEGTRNARATHPHDCEKYAPSLAVAAVTIAATAAATTSVRCVLVIMTGRFRRSPYSVVEP